MATREQTSQILSELACESLANAKKAKSAEEKKVFVAEYRLTERIAQRFKVQLNVGDAISALLG